MRRIDIFINCKNCSKRLKVTPSILRQGVKCCSRSCGQRYLWKQDWYRTKQIASHKGLMPSNIQDLIAYTRSKEGREATSKRTKGRIGWNKGRKSPETSGENNYRWILDRTQLKRQDKKDNPNYKEWRINVYKRDNFTCRIESEDCNGRIEAHHILPWRDFQELRYKLNNGITLCHAHHPRGEAKEKLLMPVFQELVLVSSE